MEISKEMNEFFPYANVIDIMDTMDRYVNRPGRIAVTWHPSLEEAKEMAANIINELRRRSVDRADAFSLNDSNFRSNLLLGSRWGLLHYT